MRALKNLDIKDVCSDSAAPASPQPGRSRILDGIPAEKPTSPPPVTTAKPGSMRGLTGEVDRLRMAEQELSQIKSKMENGQLAQLLDTNLVDPSPFPDRLDTTYRHAGFERLKESIRTSGQDQPILVRPHPGEPGRYQVAYGHRRRRACLELGITIKAIVREMNDDAMISAQRRENEEREQPSYIEKVFQVAALQKAGYTQVRISQLVNIPQPHISTMLQTSLIGQGIVEAIGSAPKSGRRQWETLQKLVVEEGLKDEALDILSNMKEEDGDERLSAVIRQLKQETIEDTNLKLVSKNNALIGSGNFKPRSATLNFKGAANKDFAQWLSRQIPDLHDQYLRETL